MQNLSIVIPVFDEEENIIRLAQEIETAFANVNFKWEVIWVNDSSSDWTKVVLLSFMKGRPNYSLIDLHHQSGQSAAILSGISHARYPLIATLDGDGQNDPMDLIHLKDELEKNDLYLAQGVRVKRQDQAVRKFSTQITNIVRNAILGIELNDVGCAVRVFKRDILPGLPAFKGFHRFLPVMVALWKPEMILEFPVAHRPRLAGKSKYGISNRLWVGIFDLFGVLWFKNRGFTLPSHRKIL